VSTRNVLFALTIIAKGADYSMKVSVWSVKLTSTFNTHLDTLSLLIYVLVATPMPLFKQRLAFIVSPAMTVLLIVKNASTSMNVASARQAIS
jgi:hypothetical protein